jgi:hypothetical protein
MDTKSKKGLMTSCATVILMTLGLVTASTFLYTTTVTSNTNHAFGGGAIVDGGTSVTFAMIK